MLFFSISNDSVIELVNTYCTEKKGEIFEEILYVSVKQQRLYHIKNNIILKEYPVSTGKKGVGNLKGSEKTPLGLHFVKEKHGQNTPMYGRMIGRLYYGQIAPIYTDTTSSKTDDITSRILWLSGHEEGINFGGEVDSYQRFIYIHGTSEEGKIGRPASHGCIRMKNKDIIELFANVKLNTKVLILNK